MVEDHLSPRSARVAAGAEFVTGSAGAKVYALRDFPKGRMPAGVRQKKARRMITLQARAVVRATVPALLLACLMSSGCAAPAVRGLDPLAHVAQSSVPRELQKATLSNYRVEPPDILLLEVVDNIRSPQQSLKPGEDVLVRASNTLPIEDSTNPAANEFKLINSILKIQSDGTIDLGPEYGSVAVAGKTPADARQAIIDHLHNVVGLAMPKVSVSLADVTGKQLIAGEHLVRPDGSISLGIYGNVAVAGMTLEEVKYSVESHLSQHVQHPEVRVYVAGYNSKV